MSNNNNQISRPTTRRQLNLPLLIATVVVVAVVAPAVYFWHGFQLVRTAGALLSRAEELEGKQQWLVAAEYVNRYLRLEPDDVDARIRLAVDYERGANTPGRKSRAADLYYRAIGLAGKSPDKAKTLRNLHEQLAEVLLTLGRYRDAEKQAIEITDNPKDPNAKRLLALALFGQVQRGMLEDRDVSLAAVAIEKALDLSEPRDIQLTMALASICRERPNWLSDEQRNLFTENDSRTLRDKARELVDELRESQPKNYEALLAHYAFVVEDDPQEAEVDVLRAIGAAPKVSTVQFVAGEFYVEQAKRAQKAGDSEAATKNLEKARLQYKSLLRSAPNLPTTHVGLGDVQLAWAMLKEPFLPGS